MVISKHCGSDTHIDAVTIISFSEVSVNASLVNVGDDGHVRHPILGFRTCKISLRLLSISPYFSLSFFLPSTPPTFTPFFKGRNVTNVTHIWLPWMDKTLLLLLHCTQDRYSINNPNIMDQEEDEKRRGTLMHF